MGYKILYKREQGSFIGKDVPEDSFMPETDEDWAKYVQTLDSEENKRRKDKSLYVESVYNGKHMSLVRQEVIRQFGDDARDRPIVVFPYARQIIDTVASLYTQEVKRELSKTNKKVQEYIYDKVFQDLTDAGDSSIKALYHQGTILVQSVFSQIENKIKYLVYPQHNFDLVYEWINEVDKVLKGVIISKLDGSDYFIYTENNFIQLRKEEDSIKKVVSVQHNKGMLPFYVLHKKNPGTAIYLEPEEGLAHQDVLLNSAWSNLYTTQANQTNALPVMSVPASQAGDIDDKGDRSDNVPYNDSSKVLILYNSEGMPISDFKFVSPDVDFQGSLSVVRESEKSFAISQGLPNNFFSEKVQVTATEIVKENARLDAFMKSMKSKFENWEQEVLSKTIRILISDDAEAPGRLNSEIVLSVSWVPGDKMSYLSIDELLKLLSNQIVDKADIVRTINPRMSREEALEYIEERYPKEEEQVIEPSFNQEEEEVEEEQEE